MTCILSSFVLGLNAYGHFALFCLDSGNVIHDFAYPIRIHGISVISITGTSFLHFL